MGIAGGRTEEPCKAGLGAPRAVLFRLGSAKRVPAEQCEIAIVGVPNFPRPVGFSSQSKHLCYILVARSQRGSTHRGMGRYGPVWAGRGYVQTSHLNPFLGVRA